MKSKLMLLFLATLFLSGSCEKEEEYELPPASQNGANTIGCRVNGKVCVPKSSGLFSPKTKLLSYNEDTGELHLSVYFLADDSDYSKGIPEMTVRIIAKDIFSVGIDSFYTASVEIETPRYTRGEWYSYNSEYPELRTEFKITKLDKNNHIISGIFRFEGIQVGGENFDSLNVKKVEVTDGRFDFVYPYQEGYSN